MSSSDYMNKYLKYKEKYLNLKKMLGGAVALVIKTNCKGKLLELTVDHVKNIYTHLTKKAVPTDLLANGSQLFKSIEEAYEKPTGTSLNNITIDTKVFDAFSEFLEKNQIVNTVTILKIYYDDLNLIRITNTDELSNLQFMVGIDKNIPKNIIDAIKTIKFTDERKQITIQDMKVFNLIMDAYISACEMTTKKDTNKENIYSQATSSIGK